MSNTKIGIIREDKVPVDRRVALTPAQAKKVNEGYEGVEVVCQSSDVRCFTEEDYKAQGIQAVAEVNDCDILIGVKEVPIEKLIPNKTYFFFSHTIKKQEYNRDLLQAILAKNVRLIDYECLTDQNGKRLIAFGRYAGIVGAYNGIMTYGKRYGLFDLKRARDCFDMEEMQSEYVKVKLPAMKIAVTGSGRVAHGAMEVLDGMGIQKVTHNQYLTESFDQPVYTQLSSADYHFKEDGTEFDYHEFYKHPERFSSDFLAFTRKSDLLIAAAYWNPKAPVLFTKEDMLDDNFKIKVIADITCDIEGSIPSTKQPSTIADPVYDYNPASDKVLEPYSGGDNVSVMAVDNLPCELPRNASEDFGKEMITHILPSLLVNDEKGVIKRATITEGGQLTELYSYLQDFVDGE